MHQTHYLLRKKQNVSQLWRLFEIFRTKNLWYPIRSSAVEVDVIFKIKKILKSFFTNSAV